MLQDARLGVPLTLVTITGGDAVTKGEKGEKRVPKRRPSCVPCGDVSRTPRRCKTNW